MERYLEKRFELQEEELQEYSDDLKDKAKELKDPELYNKLSNFANKGVEDLKKMTNIINKRRGM